jgi:hypothetical protein
VRSVELFEGARERARFARGSGRQSDAPSRRAPFALLHGQGTRSQAVSSASAAGASAC